MAAGGAALIGSGSVMTYLKAQVQEQQESDLTLANIEVLAEIGDRMPGAPYGMQCGALQIVNGKKYTCTGSVITCQGTAGMCQPRECPTHAMMH